MYPGGDYPKGADITEVQPSTKCLFYSVVSALGNRWPKYTATASYTAEH